MEWPVITVMSCRWHSPPSSQTGQSWGWFSISHSTTWRRKSAAKAAGRDGSPSEAPIPIRKPSSTVIMQAICSRPRVSASSRYWSTAHSRQEPTEPIAGCQQK